MLPEFVAYHAARRIEEWHARSARPNAPVRLEKPARARGERLATLRAFVCADLRRLADRIEPAPSRRNPARLAPRG